MNLAKFAARLAILAVAFSTATISNAEIKKCLENDGAVTYSDRACHNAIVLGELDVEQIAPAGLAVLQNLTAHPSTATGTIISAEETTIPPSRWAELPVVQSHYSTDIETVSQAREMLAALDRQQGAAPVQKLALFK